MDSLNLEEVLSLGESFEGPDCKYDDGDIDTCTVLSCVGRGVNMINISEIRMPADYYAEVQPAVPSGHASPRPKQTSGKGRAQLINEDRMKCIRPGANNTPSGNISPDGNNRPGGNCRPGGNGVTTENSCLPLRSEAQNFFEDFPPLTGSVSNKLSVTSDKPETGLSSQQHHPDSLEAIARGFLGAPSK